MRASEAGVGSCGAFNSRTIMVMRIAITPSLNASMRFGFMRVPESWLQSLVSDYLDQHSLSPSAIEFAVENLFPRTEIQFALGDCDDNFTAHDLAFEMGISVVFAGPVVAIAGGRRMRSQFLQPKFVIVMKPRFVVIDEHAGSD